LCVISFTSLFKSSDVKIKEICRKKLTIVISNNQIEKPKKDKQDGKINYIHKANKHSIKIQANTINK